MINSFSLVVWIILFKWYLSLLWNSLLKFYFSKNDCSQDEDKVYAERENSRVENPLDVQRV